MEEKPKSRRWNRLVSQLGLSSLAVGIVAGLVKAWATYWLGPSSPLVKHDDVPAAMVAAESPPAPATIDQLLKSSPISLTDWQLRVEQRYANDVARERAFREYSGRDVIWEGYLSAVHPITEGATADRAYSVILHESRTTIFGQKPQLGPPFVRCLFPEDAGVALKALQPGDWVVVRGRLSNPTLTGSVLCTDLQPVKLVTAQRIRSVDLALDAHTETVTR